MKYFCDIPGRTIESDSAEAIDILAARKLLVDLAISEEEDRHFFIGFLVNSDCIQYIRKATDTFDFDAPVLVDDEYSHSLSNESITLVQALAILQEFATGANWKQIVDLEEITFEDDDELSEDILRQDERLAIARKGLSMGLSHEVLSELTGLPLDQILSE